MKSCGICLSDSSFKILYLFLERGGREGEKHQCVVASGAPPTGDLAHNPTCARTGNPTGDPLVCRPVLNPLSHTSQGSDLFHLA